MARSALGGAPAAALAATAAAGEEPGAPAAGEEPGTPAAGEAAATPAPKTSGTDQYSCAAAPWSGSEERFVREMLLTWREDYKSLSAGELRLYILDVLHGLKPPGERYTIETSKRGSILFERKDGDILCTIRKP